MRTLKRISPSRPRPRAGRQRALRDASILTLLGLGAMSLTGALWALVHPSLTFEVMPDSSLEQVGGPADADFLAHLQFLGMAGVIAVGLAWWAYRTRTRHPLMALWIMVVVAVGTLWAAVVGTNLAGALHPVPEGLSSGAVLTLPAFISASPSLAIPTMLAGVAYGALAFIGGDEDFR